MPDPQEETPLKTPAEFLASFPGAPSPSRIEEFKSQVPGGRVKFFTSPDGKRVYLYRGYNGLDMLKFEGQVVENSKTHDQDFKIVVVSNCVLWTNTTSNGTVDVLGLRSAPAGLPETLFHLITLLSDFYDPDMLDQLSGEL